jgi:general stress protein YciG
MGIPENIREFLRVMGRQGGRMRAQKYSKEKLSAWGKRGGRPRKARAVGTSGGEFHRDDASSFDCRLTPEEIDRRTEK